MQSSFLGLSHTAPKSCLVASVPIAPTPGSQPYWIQKATGQPLNRLQRQKEDVKTTRRRSRGQRRVPAVPEWARCSATQGLVGTAPRCVAAVWSASARSGSRRRGSSLTLLLEFSTFSHCQPPAGPWHAVLSAGCRAPVWVHQAWLRWTELSSVSTVQTRCPSCRG